MKRYLIAGMSHVESLRRASAEAGAEDAASSVEFLNLRCYRKAVGAVSSSRPSGGLYIEPEAIATQFASIAAGIDAAVFCINGNEHNIIGLTEIDAQERALQIVEDGVRKALTNWVGMLRPLVTGRVLLLVPPPPIESEEHIRAHPGEFRAKFEQYPLRGASDRLELWRRQRDVTLRYGRELGIDVLEPPDSVFSSSGFLADDCCGADPTHGNRNYGSRVLRHVTACLESGVGVATRRDHEKDHPYVGLPDFAYWKQSISRVPAGDVDPVVNPRFLIRATDKVATAGSCFAQHISKRLRSGGFHFLITEKVGEGDASADARGFYDFSARYGNVYTARQLLQLFDRAFGYFQPLERSWSIQHGRFCDPFRPRIEPDGFQTRDDVLKDTQEHLAAVRTMFRELDVFVFTLGLTECWTSRLDGAAYPVAPGVAGGAFDEDTHAFVNFTAGEVRADLEAFLAKLKLVNPLARVLLTVSPVPLVATQEAQHVLVSTTYSKSVLRVAAGEVVAANPQVEYFPSYEIITGPHARGNYFSDDRRSVTDAGVDHVMRVFMTRMTSAGPDNSGTHEKLDDGARELAYARMEEAADVACDEELYAQ